MHVRLICAIKFYLLTCLITYLFILWYFELQSDERTDTVPYKVLVTFKKTPQIIESGLRNPKRKFAKVFRYSIIFGRCVI